MAEHQDQLVRDLSMLVLRLARALQKRDPVNALALDALDFLRRKGINGSPLRDVAPAAPEQEPER